MNRQRAQEQQNNWLVVVILATVVVAALAIIAVGTIIRAHESQPNPPAPHRSLFDRDSAERDRLAAEERPRAPVLGNRRHNVIEAGRLP